MPDEKPEYKVGDRVEFEDIGTRTRVGIIRYFQWQDWADEPVAIIDIDPPLKGTTSVSMGRRIEQRRIVGKVQPT